MKSRLIIPVAVIAALISACIYSDDGIFSVDPIPGDPPTISATTNLDTIYEPTIVDSLEVIYEIDIENGEVYLVEAMVRDSSFYESDTTSGSFWVDSLLVEEPGIDTLHIFIYYSTNSNSLADIVGVEYNLLDLDYPVIFEGGF